MDSFIHNFNILYNKTSMGILTNISSDCKLGTYIDYKKYILKKIAITIEGNIFFKPQRIGNYYLRSTGSNPPPEIILSCELPLYQNRIDG